MRKIRAFLAIFVVCAFSPAVLLHGGEAVPTVVVGVPQAPPALPVLRMIESGVLAGEMELKIDVWTGPEQLIAMVQDGDHHIFAFPLTVAAKLYNKGVGIKLTNVNTWGVTYFVTSDPSLQSWDDLRGKTLFVPLRSSTPDVLTQYFLGKAGLEPGRDLEVIYSNLAEIGQLLRSGRIEYAVLLEPHVTAAMAGNPSLRVAFTFADEWKKIKGPASDIPTAGLGAVTAFLDDNAQLARDFEAEYEKAVQWILDNPDEAGALAEKYLGLRAETVADAIPRLGLKYMSAADAAADAEDLFRLLYDFSPEMIGKKIPDATLYWQ